MRGMSTAVLVSSKQLHMLFKTICSVKLVVIKTQQRF